MRLKRRLEKLEQLAQKKADNGCALFDFEENEVQAKIITMPKHEVEGLAELESGTQQIPVVYDAYAIKIPPLEPPLDENKLYYRWRPGAELPPYEPGKIKVYLPDGFDIDDLI